MTDLGSFANEIYGRVYVRFGVPVSGVGFAVYSEWKYGRRGRPLSDTSLNDRLFWPAVAFAVLALGGFGYFAATKMFRSAPAAGAYSDPETSAKVKKIETSATTADAPSTQAVAAALEARGEETESASAEPAAPMAKAEDMEDGPYVLPDRAPVLSADTFKRPAPPKAPPKRPAPKAPVTPVAAKAPATTAVAGKTDLMKAPAIPLIPTPRYPTYVMNDGRRIPAAKVVDMGEFWGLKTAAGQIVSVRKEDVKVVER